VFRLRAVAASLAVAFVAAAGIYAYPILKKVDGAPHLRVWTFGSVAWGCGIVIALMIASGLRRHRGRAILVIVAIDTLALFVTPMLASLRSATIDVAPVTFLQKNLGPDRYFTLGPIAPDYSAYFGIDAINSNDNPVAKNWNTYVGTHLAPYATAYEFTGTAFWQTQQAYGSNIKDKKDLLTPDQEFELYLPNYETDGVKYIIVSTSDDPIGPAKIAGIHKVFGDPSFTIYQLPHVSPIVETLGSSCTTKSLSANSVLAYCRGPATLIRHDLYIPGWSAQVNGVGTTVSPYQSVFQSIRLGRGRSMVTFGYEPSGRSLGFGAFFAGILFLLFSLAVATGVVHRLKRRVPVAPHARSQATS
jgi:hypothetical protein